jgi:hypothetical protein
MMVQGADAKANSSGYGGSLAVSSAPARLFTAIAYNNSGADVYMQIFDATAVPTAGAWATPPLLQERIPTGSSGYFNFSDGVIFPTGIAIAISSDPTNYTAAASSCLIYSSYRVK